MNQFKTDKIVIFNYGMPLLVILFSIALIASPLTVKYPELMTAITYDLVLTAPLLFFLMAFKSKVRKLKTVPFFIGGLVIATLLIPEGQQEHLEYIKSYVLPIVEIFVFTFLLFKIRRGVKIYRLNSTQTSDFYFLSKISAQELFGKTKYAALIASEISMLYYVFFSWKRKKLKHSEFTKYKENASIALSGAFLMIICIETYAFHILLLKWSSIAAWILTGLSIYSAFSVFANLKALLGRPSILTKEKLILKNGLIADITIQLNDISKIEGFSKEMQSDDAKIGNLGLSKESSAHNIAIYFTKTQTIEKMYGFTEECDVLLVHMDEKLRFLTEVKSKLSSL